MKTSSHINTLRNPNSKYNDRIAAANAIFQQPNSRPLFRKLFDELYHGDDYSGRLLSLQIAAVYGDREIVPDLRVIIGARLDGSQEVMSLQLRTTALRALIRLAPEEGVSVLQGLLGNRGQNEAWDRIVIRTVIGLPSESAIDLCRSILTDPNSSHIHRDAAWSLAFFGHLDAVELLRLDLAQHERFPLQYIESVLALAKARDPEGLKELAKLIARLDEMDQYERNRLMTVTHTVFNEPPRLDEDLATFLAKLLERPPRS